MSVLVFEQVDNVTSATEVGKFLYTSGSNIYSAKTNKKLWTFENPFIGVNVRPRITSKQKLYSQTLYIFESNNLVFLFGYESMFIYNADDDTFGYVRKVVQVAISKHYLFVYDSDSTIFYDLEANNYARSVVGIVSEITKDIMLVAYTDGNVKIYNINNLDKCLYKKHIAIYNPNLVVASKCKVIKDDKLEDCIMVKTSSDTLYILMREIEADLTIVCNVCFNTPEFKVALVPCGHERYCSDCASKLTECTVCKTKVTSSLRVQK